MDPSIDHCPSRRKVSPHQAPYRRPSCDRAVLTMNSGGLGLQLLVKLGGCFQYSSFSPRSVGKLIQCDDHIIEMGWNHQLVKRFCLFVFGWSKDVFPRSCSANIGVVAIFDRMAMWKRNLPFKQFRVKVPGDFRLRLVCTTENWLNLFKTSLMFAALVSR